MSVCRIPDSRQAARRSFSANTPSDIRNRNSDTHKSAWRPPNNEKPLYLKRLQFVNHEMGAIFRFARPTGRARRDNGVRYQESAQSRALSLGVFSPRSDKPLR